MRDLPSGSEIAGYVVEGVAGRGGMGVVYRAVDLTLDRPVALKLISDDFARDEGFRARFKRESRLAASIRHPNVITVYHAGEHEGRLYIATEFVEGTDLKAMVAERGPLEPRLAAELTSQVASALDAAHAKGLIHRDVKPSNVLIEDGGHAYLTDFGLTKSTSSQSAMTETGLFVGTIDYAAPEQISGQPLDARTDVYALGCVLFECLTARHPYPRESNVATMYAHTHEPPPSVLEHAPGVPAGLEAVVQRAMAKAPADRYPSAGDLARAAAAAAEGVVVAQPERSVAAGAAAPGGAPSTVLATQPERPRRRWIGALAGLAVVAAAVIALIVSGGGDDKAPATPLGKDAYQDRMLDLGREINEAGRGAAELPEHVTNGDHQLKAAKLLAKVRDSIDATLRKMRRIVPPTDIEDVHAQVLDVVVRTREDIADAVAAADFGNDRKYRASLLDTQTQSDRLDSLAAEFRKRGYERIGTPSG